MQVMSIEVYLRILFGVLKIMNFWNVKFCYNLGVYIVLILSKQTTLWTAQIPANGLLFILYNIVKRVLAITFVLLLFSSWNFHNMCQRFLYNQKRNFSWIRQKNETFSNRLYGENLCLLSDQAENLFLVI